MSQPHGLPKQGGAVVPFGRQRRTYEGALVEQLTEPAIADANRRLQAILYAPEAKGQRTLAHHLAFKTSMLAEEAVAVLRAAAVEHEPGRDGDTSQGFTDFVARARRH